MQNGWIRYNPRRRHPERTTAKREVVKDPVVDASRSDSASKSIKQLNETSSGLYDVKQDAWDHLQQTRCATHL